MKTTRKKWLYLTGISVALHLVGLGLVYWVVFSRKPARGDKRPISVELVEENAPLPKKPLPPARPPPPQPIAKQQSPPSASTATRRKRAPRNNLEVTPNQRDATQNQTNQVAVEQTNDPAEKKLADLNVEMDMEMLWDIAADDPRIQRRQRAKKKPTPFEVSNLSMNNIPEESGYQEIRGIIDGSWSPDWGDIKDESISEVSLPWVKRGLKNWLTDWQKRAREHSDRHDTLSEEQFYLLYAKADYEAASDKIAVEFDLEPLPDGTWAVSIARSSDHPFFDKKALADMKKAARIFPPWKDGHGSALRYRLEARFIIVPPSTSTIIGLTCAFPLCTPEELMEAELIYWFKKIVRKNIRFRGLIKAPQKPAKAKKNKEKAMPEQLQVIAD